MPADYFETSALLKLYKTEVGSQKAAAVIQAATAPPFVSNRAVTEVLSVMNRQVRKQTITLVDYQQFEQLLLADIQAGRFDVLSLQDNGPAIDSQARPVARMSDSGRPAPGDGDFDSRFWRVGGIRVLGSAADLAGSR